MNCPLHKNQPGSWQFRLGGFTEPDILVFDVTDRQAWCASSAAFLRCTMISSYLCWPRAGSRPETAQAAPLALSAGSTLAGGFHGLRFQDVVTASTDYLAVAAGQARQPISIERDVPSDLADTSHQIDYIIIAHDDLYSSTLATRRLLANPRLSVQPARLSDVYGRVLLWHRRSGGYRDLLSYGYANCSLPSSPTFCLVGDGTYDYRDYLGFGSRPWIPSLSLADAVRR